MSRKPSPPLISVVIPTYNRASLLRRSLESLTRQTIPAEDFEVVVVDDGSPDSTPQVCEEFVSRLRLRYYYIKNSGNPAAKNLGVFAAVAPLLFFFDDDDIATETLLEEHLQAHSQYPSENVAILGYTCWAPELQITPVMEYITDIGQLLFAYKNLRHGQLLDYTYFWCGRISCKRSLLVMHGIYNQSFPSIIEDVELGYRLSKFNLSIVFHRLAVSHMARPVTYEEFCRRCERQGTALYLFSQLHPDPAVQKYCHITESLARRGSFQVQLREDSRRVQELESILGKTEGDRANTIIQELRTLYQRSLAAYRIKGIVDAANALHERQPATQKLVNARSRKGVAL